MVGLGAIVFTQRHRTLHLFSELGEVQLVSSASAQGARLRDRSCRAALRRHLLQNLCAYKWLLDTAFRPRRSMGTQAFGVIPCKCPPLNRRIDKHPCARGWLRSGSGTRYSHRCCQCSSSMVPPNEPVFSFLEELTLTFGALLIVCNTTQYLSVN